MTNIPFVEEEKNIAIIFFFAMAFVMICTIIYNLKHVASLAVSSITPHERIHFR